MINGERYYVAYEGLTNICSGCGLYGHLVHGCPVMAKKATNPQVEPIVIEETRRMTQEDAGFQTVQSSRRRKEMPTAPVVFSAGSSGDGERRSLRNISENIPHENIRTSNKFGELAIDTDLPEVREVAGLEEANKENVNILNAQGKERSTGQGKGNSFGGKSERKTNVNHTGPIEKRAGKQKPNETHKLIVKSGMHRPTRGLVFGPTREEVERSESGKRLRVENGAGGRSGGVFAAAGEERGGGIEMIVDLAHVQSGLTKSLNGGVSPKETEKETGPMVEGSVSSTA